MNGLVFFVFFRCYRQGCTVANQSSWILHGAPAHGVKAGEMLEVDGWGRLIKCWKDSRIPSNIPEAPLLCHNDEPERIRFQPKKLINWKSQDAVCSAVLRTRIGLLEFFCIFFLSLICSISVRTHISVFDHLLCINNTFDFGDVVVNRVTLRSKVTKSPLNSN